ncbi:MAG TPA: trypsin-like serine protease, partial [Polyangiaceae bacterium]|nr:trypsin-like serine protease [Polyangiaceae bacterium]
MKNSRTKLNGNERLLHAAAIAAGALLSVACSDGRSEPALDAAELGQVEQGVIIGATDGRADVYAALDRNLAGLARRSSPTLFRASALDMSNPASVQILGPKFGDPGNEYFVSLGQARYDKPLCSGERFFNDKRAAHCSASLIGEDLVLTAGHCLGDGTALSCADARFVFGFYHDSASTMQTITSNDVYSCSQIVARNNGGNNEVDYAIVRLDRKAGLRYASTRVSAAIAPIAIGTKVGVVGVPSGIPLKVTDVASVFESGSTDSNGIPLVKVWYGSTDTFRGNSGSSTYDTNDYLVKGIYSKTIATDFELNANGTCLTAAKCASPSGCRQEFTYAARALEGLCKPGGAEPTNPVCGPADRLAFSTANTANATTNTRNHWLYIKAGQVLEASTCGNGGTASGDTFLRLMSNETAQVAFNDDLTSSQPCSLLKYTAPSTGLYELRAGCYSGGACSGTVSLNLRDVSPYMEAECPATASGAFTQSNTVQAGYAGPGHVTSVANSTSDTAASSIDRATYALWAPTAGQYDLYFRVDNNSRGDQDSWFHKLDSGAWVTTNNTSGFGASWFWYKGSSAVSLSAGQHTLEVAQRESGLSLD